MGTFTIDCGPFAKTRKNVDSFCHNLFLSYAISEAIEQMIIAEEEYNEAIMSDDKEEIKKKELKLNTYQSSLTLTAYMFDETDEIST
jgi:hypothetical protein